MKTFIAWLRRNILAPPVILVLVISGLILLGFGYRISLGSWIRRLRGLELPVIRSVEPILPIDPSRLDKDGQVIPIGTVDDKGWVQPVIHPIFPPDLFSDDSTVEIITPEGPVEIELPRGVTREEVKEVVELKPKVFTVTVDNREKVATDDTLDRLLEKYGGV